MIAVIVVNVLLHLAFLSMTRGIHRITVMVLLISHIYFSVCGAWYWIFVRETHFVGVTWGTELVLRAASTLSTGTVLVVAGLVFASSLSGTKPNQAQIVKGRVLRKSLARAKGLKICLSAGTLACFFVGAAGYFGVGYGSNNRQPLFLIAYQATDLLIPAILMLVATKGFRPAIAWFVFFLVFAVLVGLRYKIALLALPGIAAFFLSDATRIRKVAFGIISLSFVLILFSLMTLYRSKFGGLDFTRSSGDVEEIVYGAFAETNLLFGLSSVIVNYVDGGNFFPLQPLIDAFKDFAPRFLFPERDTGAYLTLMKEGLITDEGMISGTTYPFLGEFLIMGGWVGLAFGSVCFVFLYMALFSLLRRFSISYPIFNTGVALVAAFMGYYHYSRGYLPQAVKGYFFVVLPYILMALEIKLISRKVLALERMHLKRALRRASISLPEPH